MIEILKETARYLVCVKPIGIAAQGTQAEAMPQLLSEQLGCGIFPVHRLDQTVGGVMVYAKTAQEAARLTQAMGQGQMQKTYLAVLTGWPGHWKICCSTTGRKTRPTWSGGSAAA